MRGFRLVLAAGLLLLALPWGSGQEELGATVVRDVSLQDFRIVPEELRVEHGAAVNLRVTNDGAAVHNFNIEGAYPDTPPEMAPGASVWLNFTASEDGRFTWNCTIHPDQMAGSLRVAPAEETTITVDATRLLLALAMTIGLGFVGFLVFDRFRIADTLFLIGFGILLGPAFGWLDVELFRDFQPLVAGFALLIIMLDAGLDLRFGDLAAGMGWGIAFSTVGFFLTVGLVGVLAHFLLDVSWILAFILGCAVTDTAGIIILPVVGQLNVPGRVKTALLVDTSLPDVYSVTLVLVLINLALASQDAASEAAANVNAAAPSFDFSATAIDVLGGFSLTLLAGFLAGVFWIRALGWLAKRRYAYMTTLAAVLGLNWGVGALGGSGPIAVLAFGLVIGNRALFGAWSRVEKPRVFQDMTQFNGEVAFLVRSFFFVYLGLILDLGVFTPWFTFIAVLIVLAIVAARAGSAYLLTLRPGPMRDYRKLLVAMLPRGTTAAVVSTLPATRGVEGADAFAAYAVVVIMITNLIFTVGLFLFFKGATKPAREVEDAGAA